jgi:hypothetical protein
MAARSGPSKAVVLRLVAVVVVLVVAVVAWWWPSIFPPADAEVDVRFVSDGFLVGYERPIADRVHESGRSTSWLEGVDVCDPSTDLLGQSDVQVLVVTGAGIDACVDVLADATNRAARLIVVSQPGVTDLSSLPDGVHIVDPERLIGVAGSGVGMPCQWWEEASCVDGVVTVRNPDGSLTVEGSDRVARMVVAALP